jgi:hypothetical protein
MAPALNCQLPEHSASRPPRPWNWLSPAPLAAALGLGLGWLSAGDSAPSRQHRAFNGGQPAPAQPAASAELTGPQKDAPIPLPQAQGQALLVESVHRADYGPLSQEFVTQANLAYCGPASIVMVLNSLGVPAPVVPGYRSYRFWTQDNIFPGQATTATAPASGFPERHFPRRSPPTSSPPRWWPAWA